MSQPPCCEAGALPIQQNSLAAVQCQNQIADLHFRCQALFSVTSNLLLLVQTATDAINCCVTNDIFHFKGKTRGAFTLPKGARNVFLNESEDTRNVLGEFQRFVSGGHPLQTETLLPLKILLVLSF